MTQKSVTIKGHIPPCVSRINGQTYVIAGSQWIPVAEGTTLDQVRYIPPKRKRVKRPVEKARQVPSSRGNKTYDVVVRSDGAKSCTCSGFMYRRRCRHIDEFKKELGWK